MTEDLTDPLSPLEAKLAAPPPEQSPADVLKKRVYIGFAATMALGMAVAGAYISGRLFANATRPAVVSASTKAPKIIYVEPPKLTPEPAPAPAPIVADVAPVAEKAALPEPVITPVVEKAQEVKAKPTPAPVAAQVSEPAPAAPHVSEAPPVQDAAIGEIINPKHGERYLQLAALGPHGTARFVPELRSSGVHAVVAPGPETNIYRVVVGPFADQPSLEKQRDALDAAGIQSMLRVY